VFAGFDEMCALLAGSPSPTADDLAQRHAFHTSHTAKEAPAHLGDPPPAMPDPSSFAPPVARLMAAVSIAFGQMFEESEAPHDRSVIRGLPASAGTREGPARRVNGPADFDRIRKGDVLLTEATTEAFNILLPLLQAIVTDSGGALSHAAIVAREYGIPAVVGTREGTLAIPDGSYVRVDGDTGEVTVLS
jgi:pyruvate,water dikinase